nr:hypothetical protein [Tanacetum cinerariifolium]
EGQVVVGARPAYEVAVDVRVHGERVARAAEAREAPAQHEALEARRGAKKHHLVPKLVVGIIQLAQIARVRLDGAERGRVGH